MDEVTEKMLNRAAKKGGLPLLDYIAVEERNNKLRKGAKVLYVISIIIALAFILEAIMLFSESASEWGSDRDELIASRFRCFIDAVVLFFVAPFIQALLCVIANICSCINQLCIKNCCIGADTLDVEPARVKDNAAATEQLAPTETKTADEAE